MISQELRYSLRTLLGKGRSLAVICVITLAVGIGASTAIFSVLRGVVLAPLPYGQPDRLVQVMQRYAAGDITVQPSLSPPDILDMRERLRSFASWTTVYTYNLEGFNLSRDGGAQRISRLKIGADYFKTLGVQPILGREFLREENLVEGQATDDREFTDAPARHLAVLGYSLWQRLYQGNPEVLGQELALDGEPYSIVGVAPRGFQDPLVGPIEVFVPQDLSPGGYNVRGNNYLCALARLKPGVTLSAAQAELDGLDAYLSETYPTNRNRRHALVPLKKAVIGDLDRTLWTLTAAVGTLLLVACMNVANLLLAWGAARRREIALRSALGCGRAGIFRQLLSESLLLAAAGGLGGWMLAAAGVPALLALSPESVPSTAQVGWDGLTFLFCAAAALGTGLIFGLLPSLRASRANLETDLRQGGRDGQDISGARLRQVLVSGQVALAVLLLATAGLLSKSFLGLLDQDLGFRQDHVLLYSVSLPMSRYADPVKRVAFYNNLHERLEADPAIELAGAVSQPPVSGSYNHWSFRLADAPANEDASWFGTQIRVVDGHYLEALEVPLLSGRLLDESDREAAPPVVLVSQSLLDRASLKENGVGTRIYVGGMDRRIVGVVGDVRHLHLQPAMATVYIPHNQFAANRNWVLHQAVRYRDSQSAALESVRRQVARLDAGLAVFSVRTLEEVASAGISQQRFAAAVMTVFSACTIFLAAVGLYGVLSHSVQRRRREIGIRMALGAGRQQVGGLVVRQALWLVCAGIVLGTGSALLAAGWIRSMLYQVDALDPQVYVLVALFLLALSAGVGWAPARRAARLDPMRVLREE